MAIGVEDILHLLQTQGAARYGQEPVSQLEHALQCAQLAEQAGCATELVIACLLHDLGHLVSEGRDEGGPPNVDDVHQYLALPFLRGMLPDAVLDPIRLHVDAKRYLCRVEPGYRDGLSPASRHSLELQGGAFDAAGAEAFLAQPHAEDALLLRRFDDLAKEPGRNTPPLAHYAGLLRSLAPQEA